MTRNKQDPFKITRVPTLDYLQSKDLITFV